mgnify:CR=1 FL=1|tara:strand:+ start:143 stop:559 length:417 start_codon:yes stop_codon:yes gene_type:complete
MKKLVEIAVPVVLGLFVGLLISVSLAKAEPPNFDQYGYRPVQQQPSQQQQRQSSTNTVVDDVIEIILAQGFSGAIIIVLFGWLYRSDRTNRESQQNNIDRFQNLSIESNKILSELVAKIDGVERELEAAKTLSMMKRS